MVLINRVEVRRDVKREIYNRLGLKNELTMIYIVNAQQSFLVIAYASIILS